MKCIFEHDGDCCNSGATQYMCKCKQPCNTIFPMTNADRIRAMSDEELAAYLHEIGWDCNLCSECERLSDNPLLRHERCDEKCEEHCLDWLKQPVKDGEDE